jgi:hypothetical protein
MARAAGTVQEAGWDTELVVVGAMRSNSSSARRPGAASVVPTGWLNT